MSNFPGKILFVCTANICRSPMAQKLLEHALKNESPPLSSAEVDSAGVAAYPGDRASENAVLALKKVGIDLADHRSRIVSASLLEESAVVFSMTENHRQILTTHFSKLPEHLYLMREFLSSEEGNEIPDPFGADLRAYEACRDSMVEAIPPILRFLRTLT